MELEFTKLSEVTVAEAVKETAHVLVENEGEIQRVPKNQIGAQPDWNETDETKASCILNKPTSLGSGGGYTYFSYYSNKLHKSNGTYSTDTELVSAVEFENVYLKSPIMILTNDNAKRPLLNFYYSDCMPYIAVLNKNMPTMYELNFATE